MQNDYAIISDANSTDEQKNLAIQNILRAQLDEQASNPTTFDVGPGGIDIPGQQVIPEVTNPQIQSIYDNLLNTVDRFATQGQEQIQSNSAFRAPALANNGAGTLNNARYLQPVRDSLSSQIVQQQQTSVFENQVASMQNEAQARLNEATRNYEERVRIQNLFNNNRNALGGLGGLNTSSNGGVNGSGSEDLQSIAEDNLAPKDPPSGSDTTTEDITGQTDQALEQGTPGSNGGTPGAPIVTTDGAVEVQINNVPTDGSFNNVQNYNDGLDTEYTNANGDVIAYDTAASENSLGYSGYNVWEPAGAQAYFADVVGMNISDAQAIEYAQWANYPYITVRPQWYSVYLGEEDPPEDVIPSAIDTVTDQFGLGL